MGDNPGMRILIADDESIIRMGLRAMLQEMGHEVFAAVNGREALEMARRQQPDLAILDIEMPYTNGLQAARALARSQPLPILLLTAFSEQSLIEEAAELQIQGYLIKPVQEADLRAAIAVAVKRFAAQQALAAETMQLTEKLAHRKLVDRAKGVLMQRQGLSEEQAYRALQAFARQQQKTVAEVAAALLKQ
jgi:AmiR/NasT family two-component response regulator